MDTDVVTIVVTGFQPFGEVQVNPSALIVEHLAQTLPTSAVCEVLPTEFQGAERRIRRLIQLHRPEMVLCLGVAPSAGEIRLERQAANVDNARLPDNAGYQPVGTPIVADGPPTMPATLPLDRMLGALVEAGIPAVASDDAGGFVCNRVMYAALDEIARSGLSTRCGFIHVPLCADVDTAEDRNPGPALALADVIAGVERCLTIASQRWRVQRVDVNNRQLAAEYFVKALSTGERTAAQRLEPLLATDVEYATNTQPGAMPIGREVFKGRAAVLNQVFGLWPATPGYARPGWSEPLPHEGGLRVVTSGAVTVDFSFNGDNQIERVYLDGGFGSGKAAPPAPSGQVEEIPLAVKGLINNALPNQTPVIVTYVDEHGAPHSSLRGSTSVIGPTEFAIWVRHGDGGLPRAIVENSHVSLFYSDRRANAVVVVMGQARIAEDDETRRRVFEQSPEVEQTHDPQRHGVAVVIDVRRLQANTGPGRGNYTLVRNP